MPGAHALKTVARIIKSTLIIRKTSLTIRLLQGIERREYLQNLGQKGADFRQDERDSQDGEKENLHPVHPVLN